MNDTLQNLLLGIIQGLTEFLPVSSSGHLEIGKAMFGFEGDAGESMLVSVVLHFATALSTVAVFWKDILAILRGLLEFRWNDEWKFCCLVAVSMIPAAAIGLAFEEQIEEFFSGRLGLVGLMLLVTGLLLLLADKTRNTTRAVGWIDAFVVGIAQAVAILPGISRSGATISTSVLLGIDRAKAARFSFLMVIPLILGANLLKIRDVVAGDEKVDVFALGVGFVAAFVTGVLACRWMIALVRRCQLRWFAFYCLVVGAIAIGWTFLPGEETVPGTALGAPESLVIPGEPA